MSNSHGSWKLQQAIWKEISTRNPDDPHAWAMARRLVHGRFPVNMPALAAITRDDHEIVVVQKSAQVGVTEMMVNMSLWAAATMAGDRGNVLYLMPTADQMADFAAARFDRAIEGSPALLQLLHPDPPRRRGADSRRLKYFGDGVIYLRGTGSARQVASVDADLVLLDEFDQMDEGIFDLALQRLGSSRAGRLIAASTPRYPAAGINRLHLESDRRQWFIPCPSCGLDQTLNWPDSVDFERELLACTRCHAGMDVLADGRWVSGMPGNDAIHGYQVSQLLSPWINIPAVIRASQAQGTRAQQEFMNSVLGEAFSPPGGGLTFADLDSCRAEYALEDYAGEPCDIGVDVGVNYLHVVAREDVNVRSTSRNFMGRVPSGRPAKLWLAKTIRTFDELAAICDRLNACHIVIDAQPETRQASEFIRRRPGARIAYYAGHEGEIKLKNAHGNVGASITMDRADVLDRTFERFRDGSVVLPAEARDLAGPAGSSPGEYYRQVTAIRRSFADDAEENTIPVWSRDSGDDHFAHAEVYCWAADYLSLRSGLRMAV